MAPVDLKPGDPCPVCGSDFEAARVPTPAMRKAAEDRETRTPFPPFYDTASEAQREEIGALHTCPRCEYQTRFPLEAAAGKGRGKAKE